MQNHFARHYLFNIQNITVIFTLQNEYIKYCYLRMHFTPYMRMVMKTIVFFIFGLPVLIAKRRDLNECHSLKPKTKKNSWEMITKNENTFFVDPCWVECCEKEKRIFSKDKSQWMNHNKIILSKSWWISKNINIARTPENSWIQVADWA